MPPTNITINLPLVASLLAISRPNPFRDSLRSSQVKNFDSLKSKAGKKAANEINKQIKEAKKNGQDPPTETPEHASEVASAAIEMPESLLDARETLSNTDKLVDESSLQYEERRIVDMQLFLEDFMRREILWHARAMEILSPLVEQVRGVDSKGAAASFNTRLERVSVTAQDDVLNEAEKTKRASMSRGDDAAKDAAEASKAMTAKEAAGADKKDGGGDEGDGKKEGREEGEEDDL